MCACIYANVYVLGRGMTHRKIIQAEESANVNQQKGRSPGLGGWGMGEEGGFGERALDKMRRDKKDW